MPEVDGRLDREPADNPYRRTMAACVHAFPALWRPW